MKVQLIYILTLFLNLLNIILQIDALLQLFINLPIFLPIGYLKHRLLFVQFLIQFFNILIECICQNICGTFPNILLQLVSSDNPLPTIILLYHLCELLSSFPSLLHSFDILLSHVILCAYPLEHIHEVAFDLFGPSCIPSHCYPYLFKQLLRNPLVHSQIKFFESFASLCHVLRKSLGCSVLDHIVSQTQLFKTILIIDGLDEKTTTVILQ